MHDQLSRDQQHNQNAQNTGQARRSTDFFERFLLPFLGSLIGRASGWTPTGDSNLPSLEASRPEGAAFQGKLRFPGRVPFRVFIRRGAKQLAPPP